MSHPASVQAVIARLEGESWRGRFVHQYGAPADLGPILHQLAHDSRGDIEALIHTLIEEHHGWNRLAPGDQGLGDCRCHDPQPVAASWPETDPATPGQCAKARYAYILGPDAMEVEVRVGGDWHHLSTIRHARTVGQLPFDLMVTRADRLLEAAAWHSDPLN
jgi:hypothetical protein